MLAALFALGGVLIGVMGSAVSDFMRDKRRVEHRNKDEFRSACAEFTSQLGRIRRYLFRIQGEPQDEELWKLIDSTFTEVRAYNERLLITAESTSTQEAAEYVIHFTSCMIQAKRLNTNEYSEFRAEFEKWLEKLYISIRGELGLKNPANVYVQRLRHLHVDSSAGESVSEVSVIP